MIEQLPDTIKFDINPGYKLTKIRDGRIKLPWGGRLLMPYELIGMDYVSARKVFWVDGCIPKWINLNVIRIDGDFTIIQIRASTHITNDDTKLYHYQVPPFHVLGPPIPIDLALAKKVVKFSIYDIHNNNG